MAAAQPLLDHLSLASAEKWKAISNAAKSGWRETLRLCLIIFVSEAPPLATAILLTVLWFSLR